MECLWFLSLADPASGGAETAGSTTSVSALSAGTPVVAPMGISGAGGSRASGYSVGFRHSLCSGGAVFSTGWGGCLITKNFSSLSWGSEVNVLSLALG